MNLNLLLLNMLPCTDVFVFYNIYSGNRQGQLLHDLSIEEYVLRKDNNIITVTLCDMMDRESMYKASNKIMNHTVSQSKVLIIIAGGDGSFCTTIQTLIELQPHMHFDTLYFSVLSLGSRNDLSSYTGYGRSTALQSITDLNTIIIKRLNKSHIGSFDVWSLEIESGELLHASHTNNGKKKVAFVNYLNIGLQGSVVWGYEKRRHKRRYQNMIEIALQSIKVALFKKKENMADSIQSVNGNKIGKSVELLMNNINHYFGREILLWNSCDQVDYWTGSPIEPSLKSSSNDGKLDLILASGLSDYLLKQFSLTRRTRSIRVLGQEKRIDIELAKGKDVTIMVDGECFKTKGVSKMIISRLKNINLLYK